MIEKNKFLDILTFVFLIIGIIFIIFPIYYCFIAATHDLATVMKSPMPLYPGVELFHNFQKAFVKVNMSQQLINSFIMAMSITIGKISISILSAFALIYFNFRGKNILFWMIFITLMLPVEVRILPTYEVASNILSPINKIIHVLSNININLEFSLLNSYSGLVIPLIASATATFLFRQFFLTIPDEICDAAKIDGATPMQFFFKIILPLSKTNIASLAVIIFVYGWNQYLWPLLITTSANMKTSVVGLQDLIPKVDELPEWNVAMAAGLLILIPPTLIVIIMQKWFIKGLIDNEK